MNPLGWVPIAVLVFAVFLGLAIASDADDDRVKAQRDRLYADNLQLCLVIGIHPPQPTLAPEVQKLVDDACARIRHG